MYQRNGYALLNGLGLTTSATTIALPTFNAGGVQATAPAAAGSGSLWSNLLAFGNKVASTVKTVAPVAKDLKSQIDALKNQTKSITTGITQQQTYNNAGTPPAKEGMSTGAKVAIGVGLTTAVIATAYLVIENRKKKK